MIKKGLLTVMVAFLSLLSGYLFAQQDVRTLISYPFDKDSLYGFNEEMTIQEGLANKCTAQELKYFLYKSKREFIINKYHLKRNLAVDYLSTYNNNKNGYPSVQTVACNNEDFELGSFTGWTVNQGSNSNSCTMAGCCSSGYGLAWVVSTPYADPCPYLGTIPNSPLGGTKVARLNDCTAGAKAVRIEKTFAVTSSNALFQFAFMTALENPGHACCDQPYLKIDVLFQSGCTGAPTPTSCPSFSIVPPTSGCTTTYTNWASGSGYNYTPNWITSSIDLSAYIGSCVTIRFTVGDCTLGGHAGYAYIDCLCSPMDIIGNGTNFPAGTPNITLPTCGATSATITAPPGLAPYVWQGPAGFPTQTVQTVTTNITGNYTLTMNPPGSCSPIVKVITVTITPNPAIQANVTQPTCSNSVAVVSTTCSSGAGSYTVAYSPTATASGSTSANTFTATGIAPGVGTATVTDAVGCQMTTTFAVNPTPIIPTFSISLSGDTLTCTQTSVTANAISTNTAATSPSYTFTSISSGTSTTNPYIVTNPGTYTVLASDAVSGCVYTRTFTVGSFTTIPTVSVTPGTINVPCTGTAPTFTGSSTPTLNILYSWVQPGPTVISGNLCTPGMAGTYTFVATNIANGCSNTKTVAVSQSTAAPTMTITAVNNNFNIKCSPNTVTLVVNGTQAPGGGVPMPYWTNGTGTTTLSTLNTFSVNIPGNYVGCIYDPAPGGCVVCQTITVGMDTLRPNAGFITNVPSQTLTCLYPCAIPTGTSSTSNVNINWQTSTGVVPSNTISVCTTTNTSQTTIGTSSVVVTSLSNGCVTKYPVTFYQDIKPLGLIAKATPSVLTCKDIQATLQFTPTPPGAILTYTWTTPAPTFTDNAHNPVTFYASGTYSLCSIWSQNGCKTCTTVNVGSNTTPPATVTVPTATIACGYTNTTINAGTTPTTGITYIWDGPTNSTISPINGYSPTVNVPGTYYVIITNTVTGCSSKNSVNVVNGGIHADFTPNPNNGFAPLPVSFTNNSSIGNPSNTTYIWAFGNGQTYTTTTTGTVTTLPGASTTYQAPGTYTVLLIVHNGTCIDTVSKLVTVDIPSDLTVPNVFTPNGDGVNDYYILNTTNLTDIDCKIYDRWGVIMYDVTTDKGNIHWDGKTTGGKEAPAGTYFYIIKATGKDGKAYEKNGYITLIR